MTPEELFRHLGAMSMKDRSRFFSLVGRMAFQDASYSHEEVFGHLADAELTATEAADYLEVSMATFRRFVRDRKIAAASEIARSQLFSAAALREFKLQRQAVKG